jgi:predicted metal-dependent phosphotriesterase family hydrolase
MTFIRTVLGDIPPEDAGVTYAHEHIIIDPSFTTEQYPEFELSSVEKAVTELMEFRAAGGSTVVDTMPCASGRNVKKLAEVSRLSGVHIVCPTGLHLSKYYPQGHWSERVAQGHLAKMFVDDITEGVDANDYSGSTVDRTSYCAGVIKVAGSVALTPDERTRFLAAADASRITGCPIITHTEEGKAAIDQAHLLIDAGVSPSNITLSHTDRNPDLKYHRSVLDTGVFLEYDGAFRWKDQTNHTTALIAELAPEYPNQLMLGMDAARSAYWKSYGGKPGLTFLLDRYRDELSAAGVSGRLVQMMFIENPARAYAFDPGSSDT